MLSPLPTAQTQWTFPLRKALATLATITLTLAPSVAQALQRGDTGYICYTRHSGFLWARQEHSCQFVVLEVLGSRYRVEFLEHCPAHRRSRGDRQLLERQYVFTSRCH